MKHGEVTEVYLGNGITELVPAEVEPDLKPVGVDAPFYFFAEMIQPRKRSWKNLLVCLSVIGPMWAVAMLNNIGSDAIFTGLCWLTIIWAGIVIFANTRRKH